MSFYFTATRAILQPHQQDDNVDTVKFINVTENVAASIGACAMEILFFVCLSLSIVYYIINRLTPNDPYMVVPHS
jgi:hypothetical protein